MSSSIAGLAEAVKLEVQAATPVDTGKARDSWKTEQTGPLAFQVTSDVDYIVDLNDEEDATAKAEVGFIQTAATRAVDGQKA